MTRSSRPFGLLAASLLSLGSCNGDEPTVVVVTVEARPSVLDVSRLEVTVHNQDASTSDAFELGDQSFPVTFSVTPTDRNGELRVEVLGIDAVSLTRASGSTGGFGSSTAVANPSESVLIRNTSAPPAP